MRKDLVWGLAVEQELSVGRFSKQPSHNPSGANGPGSLDVAADILEANGDQASGLCKPVVLGCRTHAAQATLAADRFQEKSPFPVAGCFSAQPCADDKAAAWLQDPGRLGEEYLEISHVLGAFDRKYGVKGGRLEVVCQPIAQQVGRVGRLWLKAHRMLMLSCRDSQPRDLGTIVACQDSRGSTIAAADVAHSIAGTHAGLCGDLRDQTIGCLFGRLLTRPPEAMMNVLTPDFTIETVEIVIVSRDFTGLKWWPWLDHVVAVLTSKDWNACSLDSDDQIVSSRLRRRFCLDQIKDQLGIEHFFGRAKFAHAGGFDSRW